ncbi:hypothetical protein Lal_00022775 [Lupinus albus]|uniref:Putative universal stress protein A n=1 Tax=Lupinus albus TaxID=3870 RepID=A0A6A5MTM8_LUPAL|nr:putative universal stress protein A [Lupinus albus]KAF1878066.1 hypothetical protein Lal_00022775 [Lupinus albus]
MTETSVVGGSGSDQVSASAGRVMEEERRMKMKVMVAIDESEGSFYALQWALDQLFVHMTASQESSIESVGMVYLVHVQTTFNEFGYQAGPYGTDLESVIYTNSTAMDSIRNAQKERSSAILSRAMQMCKDKQVKAETMILNGDPREMICKAAEQVHVNLLVVGSRGLGMLPRVLIGSVSDYCAHHAKTPVLIVKPPMDDNKDGKEH